MVLANEFGQLFIDRIAGIRQRSLILFGGIPALHDTKISRSRANVDDHRVQQGFQSISHGKRLGHQHHAIGDSIHGAPQALFAYPKGFGGHADDGAYLLTAFAFLFHPAERHQVS